MGFFKKIKKFALPAIGALIAAGSGGALSPALGAAFGSGLSSYTSNHDPLAALLSAGGSYAGSAIGASLGSSLGTVGGAAGSLGVGLGQSLPGDAIGNFIGNVAPSIGSALGSANIGSLIGSSYGSGLGESFAGNDMKGMSQLPAAPAGPAPFEPKQDAEKDLPSSLTGAFGSLAPDQQSTGIANQGVYGGGLGPQEQEYYVNQAQRRLVDPMGKAGDPSKIFNPIEQSYLSKLGLGGYSSGANLAELISKWRPS